MSHWWEPPAPIPPEQLAQPEWADVVVVGLGYAGTAAARAASEAGGSVIGLEMKRRERYISLGRDIGHINSKFLASRGVPPVDPIDLYNELLRRAGNRVLPSLLMQFAQNSGEAFDWFTDTYGVDGLGDVKVAFWPNGAESFKQHPGADYNGYHFWNGTAQFPDPRGWPGTPTLPDVVMANLEKAEALGARLHFGVTAVQPVMRGRCVAGVIARSPDGTHVPYLARRGVLLAAGGFSGNPDMMRDLVTDIQDLLKDGQEYPRFPGQKGLGHQIGVWAGGRLEPRPLPVMGGNYVLMKGFTTYGILWLDRNGHRFCNETFGGPEICSFPATQMPRGVYYNIFDEHVLEDLKWAVPAHGGFDELNPASLSALREIMARAAAHPKGHPDSMEPMLNAFPYGYVAPMIYSGTSPEELAENAGLSGALAGQVAASIHRYNQLCATRRDEDFGKDAKLLRPLTGRLFLQPVEQRGDLGFMLTTVGGFVTDEHQNVLDRQYEPIPGLYASGNCCGRRFGPAYTTPIAGISIGMAITLGREAGKEIVQAEVQPHLSEGGIALC